MECCQKSVGLSIGVLRRLLSCVSHIYWSLMSNASRESPMFAADKVVALWRCVEISATPA